MTQSRNSRSHGLLYLSRADVTAALPPPLDLIAAVERAFAAYGSGAARIGDKARVPVRVGHFFQTMLGRLEAPPVAGMKWFGVVPENPARGLPNVSGIIVLSDVETAQPIAVLDGCHHWRAHRGDERGCCQAAGPARCRDDRVYRLRYPGAKPCPLSARGAPQPAARGRVRPWRGQSRQLCQRSARCRLGRRHGRRPECHRCRRRHRGNDGA
ncbi:MAG: hypothetical protein JO001_15745 [Alphaproteobacteria bacterium]|nr:hypothetical protein [Alphaproteobacteria bacterium]